MDFGTLLSVAQKNERKQERKACYQTKFAPPKKEIKQSKVLSNNIKKFLAKKEEEERRKAEEEKRKKENLLALRDHKAQSRINKHLKVCKAANKSVLADAIDNENTAVTIAGPSQCDEDDYGYVSQEASAFYNKLMNKYSSLPPEKPLFSDDGKKTVKDIASTKDRVKQALKQQEIEDSLPHKRKRKHKDTESDTKNSKQNDLCDNDSQSDKEIEPEKEEKPRPKKKPMPPPMDFTELLKLAEKKQYEPIKIEPKPKPKDEPERLMTKKQMKEYAKEKEWRERKEQRNRNPESARPGQSLVDNSKGSKYDISKPSKLNSVKSVSDINSDKTALKSLPTINKKPLDKSIERNNMTTVPGERSKHPSKPSERSNNINRPPDRSNNVNKQPAKSNIINRSVERNNMTNKPVEKNNINRSIDRNNSVNKNSSSRVSEKDAIAEERKKLEEEKRKLEEMRRSIEEERKKLLMSKSQTSSNSQNSVGNKIKEPTKSLQSSSTKNNISKQNLTNNIKSRSFPPADVKPRQFPPPDVRSSKPKSSSSKLKVHKRRIYDEDDEEYDSELDDFIDDGSEGEGEDYSKYISEIFGYDKSKYRHIDDDDDTAMESNFAQQLKEEFRSTKIGIMEDLEDIRKEALEKKRKALMKNKRKI